jgi:hypothetical protein
MHSIATLAALLISFVATTAFAQSAKDVNVTNLSNPQNVAGSVEVSGSEVGYSRTLNCNPTERGRR